VNLDAVLGDEAKLRHATLSAAAVAPEYLRSAFAAKLAAVANEAAEALATAEEARAPVPDALGPNGSHATRLGRACAALSLLGVGVAKMCLLRIADEGTPAVKTTLARALRGAATPEGRAVLVHLLSDEDAQADALAAIAVAPWPEVLQHLMEVAESDDRMVQPALKAIARCGVSAGPNERYAAGDFLLEQLDDDALMPAALDALLRFGTGLPGVADRAKGLARQTGARRVAGLCLVAATTPHDVLELARDENRQAKREPSPKAAADDEATARALLAPLLRDADPRVREAAEAAARALGVS
jgi:hypothetical protein